MNNYKTYKTKMKSNEDINDDISPNENLKYPVSAPITNSGKSMKAII